MYTLKIPSADFAISALKASAKAGYRGAFLLLARRLPDYIQSELQNWWEDMDDFTGKDILVLFTGLKTIGQHNAIQTERPAARLFADGLAISRLHRHGFERHFEDLLQVAEPTPDTPQEDAFTKRLISGKGINEIRNGLQISERQIPALLFFVHEENREFLICLGNDGDMFSPVRIIHEIVKQTEEIAGDGRETILGKATVKALANLEFAVVKSNRFKSRRIVYCRSVRNLDFKTGYEQTALEFDLFLSYNSRDREKARDIARKLHSRRVRVWYDEWETRGQRLNSLIENGLRKSKATAVLFGEHGLGGWQNEEAQAAFGLAVEENRSLLLVLLPGAPAHPSVPLLLKNRAWIDMRSGVNDHGLDQLIDAIKKQHIDRL